MTSLASRSTPPASGSMAVFDYESKTWGGHRVEQSPTYLGALRLGYCLEDLKRVQRKVLEVGCGAGGMAKAIKAYRQDLQVYGCDISEHAIQVARQTASEVDFELGNAYDLPYEDNSFQAVVMFDVLEHLDDPLQAISEIRRVLQDDGLFHLFVPCEGELHSLHGILARAGWRAKERYGGHIQRFTLRRLKELLSDSGFCQVRSRWSCHLINQAVDVCYFTGLSLRGRNTTMSVEGFLDSADHSFVRSVVSALKALIAALSYYESRFLDRLPGSGAHLAGVKSGKPPAEKAAGAC